jgi:hypothetical protein
MASNGIRFVLQKLFLLAGQAICLFIPFTAAWADSAASGFLATPSWTAPSADQLNADIEAWLVEIAADDQLRAEVLSAWSGVQDKWSSAVDHLDAIAEMLSLVDARAAALVQHCSQGGPLETDVAWLIDSQTPRLLRANMRLYYARWLVHQGMYDEALEWTADLTTSDVAAPELLLFCQAVCHLHLVHPAETETLLSRLLEREAELPMRYQQLARLMSKDIEGLKDDSLDHIARRMADIRRRLEKGRAGPNVQQIEDGVIASLDKLIDDIEKKQQQMSQQAQSGGVPSGTPMQDSRLAELKAPGKVDHRDVGDTAGWGNVPPKDREQAMQQIGREFPSHYREVIEQYFRELANESSGE